MPPDRRLVVGDCRFTAHALAAALARRGLGGAAGELDAPDRPSPVSQHSDLAPTVTQLLADGAVVATLDRRHVRLEALATWLRTGDVDALLASRPAAVPPSDAPVLTPRETDVLHAIAAGGSASTIADQLGISTSTVDNHKARIYAKLGVQNQAAAVATAARAGLLRARDDA